MLKELGYAQDLSTLGDFEMKCFTYIHNESMRLREERAKLKG